MDRNPDLVERLREVAAQLGVSVVTDKQLAAVESAVPKGAAETPWHRA
jgi:hypothetical protein